MKQPESSSYDTWMDRRVEAYVDGELPEEERARFERILQEDASWASEVRQARRIKGTLHSMSTASAPEELTQSILDQTTRARSSLPLWKSVLQQVMQTWRALVAARRRPGIDYAVGLALVAVAAFFIVFPLNPNGSGSSTQVASQLDIPSTPPYSDTELQSAASKARWAVATLSQVSITGASQTGRSEDGSVQGLIAPRLGVTGAPATRSGAATDSGQREEPLSLTSRPGFVDLTPIDRWFETSPSVNIDLRGAVLGRIADQAAAENADFAEVLRSLSAIQVRSYAMTAADPDSVLRRADRLAGRLESSGWTRALPGEPTDRPSQVFLRRLQERVDGMVVLSIDPADRALFMNVVGDVRPAEIVRIGDGFDIPSLENGEAPSEPSPAESR